MTLLKLQNARASEWAVQAASLQHLIFDVVAAISDPVYKLLTRHLVIFSRTPSILHFRLDSTQPDPTQHVMCNYF